jgi:hypothetical protein
MSQGEGGGKDLGKGDGGMEKNKLVMYCVITI